MIKKFFSTIWKFFRSVGNAILVSVYVLIAVYTTLLTGCASLMPTRESPIAEPLGYNVWDFKGWTFIFMTEAVYNIEVIKLKAYKESTDLVNKPFIEGHGQAVNWLNIALSASAFGGIPLALRTLPKGAVRKEDYERDIARAGNQNPDDFNRTT